MKIFFITSHVLYINKKENHGPAHDLYDFLINDKKRAYFIKHDISGIKNDYCIDNNNKVFLEKKGSHNLLLRYLLEVLFNIECILKIRKNKNIFLINIAIDPINGISGVVAKLFGWSNKFIYYTVDYAEKRFENVIINKIYHFLDRVSLLFADEVWSVSLRIIKKREEQRVKPSLLKYVPNSPIGKPFKNVSNFKRIQLVSISHLTKSFDIDVLIGVLNILKKKYKNITLVIIGSGPEEKNIKNKIAENGLKDITLFAGQKSKAESLKIISRSFLGFAIYTNKNSFNKYGDSMKAREYVFCGVPVIINTVPSTSDDVLNYNAGLVVDNLNFLKIADFIEKCIEDKKYYALLVKNALRMAKDYSKTEILKKLLSYE